jgi:SnoaL-like domain
MNADDAVLRGVTQTYFDYAEAFDDGDIDSFSALFIDGCYFGNSDSPRSIEWIAQRAAKLRRQLKESNHYITNIRLRARTAMTEGRASAYVYSWQQDLGGSSIEGWGRYQTTFHLKDGRWLIAHHRIEIIGTRPENFASPPD